jgi:hypothetical protein
VPPLRAQQKCAKNFDERSITNPAFLIKPDVLSQIGIIGDKSFFAA